jgi:cell division protein FtsI (penicillin-binding protein 3)
MTAIAVSASISSGRGQLVNLRQRALLIAKFRVLWVLCAFSLIAMIAMIKLVWTGFGQDGPDSQSFADALLPPRGEIVDRNGQSLARLLPTYALWFNTQAVGDGPALIKSPEEVAAALMAIFPDENYDRLLGLLKSGQSGYLRRRIMPEDANKVLALGEPALQFPKENERYYPQGSLAAFVLGYVDAAGQGQLGMEQVLNERLSNPALRGAPIMLSMDSRVQGALEDELARAIRESNANGGGGIVLDADTGEVLALASLPTFDPNRPQIYDEAGRKLMRNVMTSEIYELGSVFKPITVASAIEAGTITNLARRYPAGAEREVGGHLVHDHHDYGASMNVPEALIHSSNIVLAQVGDELGGQRLNLTLRSLGFDAKPFIELPARGQPNYPHEWSRVTTTTVAYGHGIEITPMHLAAAYAAMVNGGVWRPATLMKLQPGQAPAGRRVWKASTSARMRQLLRLIANIGTGRSANAQGFRVGGKTGTAEVADQFGYHKDRVVTTFASAFPMDHPRYVVLATLVEPKATAATSGQRTAAYNAAPVVGRLVPRIGPLLGIMPDDSRDIDITDLAPLVANGDGE